MLKFIIYLSNVMKIAHILNGQFHSNHETQRTDNVNVLFMKYIFCVINLV